METQPVKTRPWLAALPPLLVCLGLSALVWQRDDVRVTPLTLNNQTTECAPDTAPKWELGYPDDGASATLHSDGWHLLGPSWLRGEVCGAGTLHISAAGDEAQDETGEQLPRLEVSLDGEKLASEAFSKGGEQVTVKVPHAGRVTLAYLNDYYKSEYRSAELVGLNLRDAHCPQPITLLPDNTAQWIPATSTAIIVNKIFKFEPCQAGSLEMKIWGQAAEQIPPKVRFEQGGRVILEVTPTLQRRLIRLPVAAGPVSVSITNPYAKELADRNLYLREVTFAPEP